MKIITHSGNFHPDDVLAVASLLLLYPDAEVVRTRDEEIINSKGPEDIVLDVGGKYDPSELRFDHHQTGGAGARKNGIPYAALGLIWKEYGAKIAGSERAAMTIEEKIVWQVDSGDNGIDVYKRFRTDLKPYLFEGAIISHMLTWEEKGRNIDEAFMEAVHFVTPVLKREIIKSNAFINGENKVIEAYERATDKRLILLDNSYAWKDVITRYPEPLYVVMNDGVQATWAVSAIRKDAASYQNRKSFPESWAGKTGSELAAITGVPDAYFAHKNRFLVIANSKEGALQLAKLALEA